MTDRQFEFIVGGVIGVAVVLALRFWVVPAVTAAIDAIDIGPAGLAIITGVVFVLVNTVGKSSAPSNDKARAAKPKQTRHGDDVPEGW